MIIYKEIAVELDESSYPIIIGRGLLGNIKQYIENSTKNKKIIIVSDVFFKESVSKKIKDTLSKSGYEVFEYYMDAGKGNKNINEVLKIVGVLEENNLPRDSSLIAIGGGVIGDLGGFVASTWLRGMNLIHIPTTLMSMVDSSVGGKTAINFRKTINAIGSYYHPVANIMDLDFIDMLSDRDYNSGIAEVIKCGIINDSELYLYLEKNQNNILARKRESMVIIIGRALEIKISHVKGDIREGGKRLLLNYGHTLGHAIEISTEVNNQEQYRHGEGVSIGIMAVAYVAQKYLGLQQNLYNSFEKMFKLYSLPTYVNSKELGFDRDVLLDMCIKNVHKDKKRIDNHLRLILASDIGETSVYTDVETSLIEEAFRHIIR